MTHTTQLSVNVNKVALVRNTRHLGIPSVLRAAEQCLRAGAQGITVHPRSDERHIRPRDVFELAELLQGWPLADAAARARVAPLIAEARAVGVRVSLFTDPDAALMPWARELGADRVELYTEPYAAAYADPAQRAEQIARYAHAARAALDAGLGVNAGHDLNRDNLGHFLEQVPGVAEVSIGHAFIADALELGYADTVLAYLRCMGRA